ncbi:MAG: hypothetical protein AAF394_08955, partial [Planctomycetota bacterium]
TILCTLPLAILPAARTDLCLGEILLNTPVASILLFVLASLFGAVGQFLYKSGADSVEGSLVNYLTNFRILGGIACYTAVMVLFVAAFKRGGELSVLYPIYASTFIWAALIGLFAYGTSISLVNIVGMLLLIAGMYCMGLGQ